jgi:hypothetical protein
MFVLLLLDMGVLLQLLYVHAAAITDSVCVCVCGTYIVKPTGRRVVPQFNTEVAKPLTQ